MLTGQSLSRAERDSECSDTPAWYRPAVRFSGQKHTRHTEILVVSLPGRRKSQHGYKNCHYIQLSVHHSCFLSWHCFIWGHIYIHIYTYMSKEETHTNSSWLSQMVNSLYVPNKKVHYRFDKNSVTGPLPAQAEPSELRLDFRFSRRWLWGWMSSGSLGCW